MTDEAATGGDGGASQSSTGDAEVDRILAVLDDVRRRPVSDHADVYLEVLDRLSSELNPEQKLRQAGAHGAA